MADPTYKKISELTELAEHPATTDYFPFVDVSANATKRVTLANIDKLKFLELTDPASDQIAFWDDSASKMDWLTAGDALTITGGSLDVDLLGIEDLADPGADKIMFWDDSAGILTWLTAGDGLTLSGTTLSAGIAEGQIADGAVTDAKWGGSYLYGFIVVPDTQYLVEKDSLLTFPVADIHNGKNVLRITARIATTSSSGNVTVRVYNVTKAAVIGTATITAGNTIGYTESFTQPLLAANDIFRIDVTGKGTGSKGLNILIRVGS